MLSSCQTYDATASRLAPLPGYDAIAAMVCPPWVFKTTRINVSTPEWLLAAAHPVPAALRPAHAPRL
jgi:hypothetical protein